MAVKVDLSVLRKLDERLTTKEEQQELDALTDKGFTVYEGRTPFDATKQERPSTLQATEPSTASLASPAKESKPAPRTASETASRPQKKPLLDSSGTINYSKYERANHEFLERLSPPPIDEAYYKGLSEDDLRDVAKSFDEAVYTLGTIDYLLSSPTEQAYWERVKAEQFETSRKHSCKSYLEDLLSASRTALEGDYIRQLEDCLKRLHAFDLLEPETACKGE